MSLTYARAELNKALARLVEAQLNMSNTGSPISQAQFDIDLQTFVNAVSAYETAANAYIAAVATAAPNLATEDAEVAAASTALATAQAALTAAKP